MNSIVLAPNKEPKSVKNLGWLLRHWQEVEKLGFNYYPENMNDGELVAYLRGGKVYLTKFASLSVCWNWLDRPIFRGVKFKLVIFPIQSWRANSREKEFTIGDAGWKEINKLEYKEFLKKVIDS